mmetsp:Transcript_35770/g.83790  ORF Transcript_35770/g.83790 Transcript_35770/m.83790 type:complete len:228 (+) Transcript_35770:430-1113(+)
MMKLGTVVAAAVAAAHARSAAARAAGAADCARGDQSGKKGSPAVQVAHQLSEFFVYRRPLAATAAALPWPAACREGQRTWRSAEVAAAAAAVLAVAAALAMSQGPSAETMLVAVVAVEWVVAAATAALDWVLAASAGTGRPWTVIAAAAAGLRWLGLGAQAASGTGRRRCASHRTRSQGDLSAAAAGPVAVGCLWQEEGSAAVQPMGLLQQLVAGLAALLLCLSSWS